MRRFLAGAAEIVGVAGQSLAGLLNETAVLAVRALRSANSVPAVTCTSVNGLLALIDAELFGGDPLNHAIELNDGRLFARNVLSEGYASALTLASNPVPGAYLDRSRRRSARIGENSRAARRARAACRVHRPTIS